MDSDSSHVTVNDDETTPRSPATLAPGAVDLTLPAEGSQALGPPLAETQAFQPGDVLLEAPGRRIKPPEASRTCAEMTLDLDSGPIMVDRDGIVATEPDRTARGVGSGETIDSSQVNQTTEQGDRSDRLPGQPPPARRSGARVDPVLPGYKLLEEIGRGGMGIVYKAWHERLDRAVALKMILAGAHASPEHLERFQIEAQAVAQIQDIGIVQIYEVGEHEGLPYFSLEFVAGGSLEKKIGGRPQPPREAAIMVRKLALSIHKAHLRKIIHRDLKPANVLLTPEGEPKITDFGLAKRMEVDSHQTRSGAIMGTPSYMAPEQAWGQTREIGTHTDQYALGTILYEMLVGHVPFQGATALETLELARSQEPVPPTRLQPKIPVDLETICLKCLQKEPARRYADVAVLAEELERFLDNKPILARPIGQVERGLRWCRRNPKMAGLAATVAAALATVAIVLTASNIQLKTLNQTLEKSIRAESAAKQDAEEKRTLAVAARVDAEKAWAIAEEARKKEAEQAVEAKKQLERARKAVEGAIAQNKNILESARFTSILINQRLSPIPRTREIREELIKTAMNDLNHYTNSMKQLSSIFEDRESDLLMKRTLAGINQRAGRLAEEYERYEEANNYFQEMDRLAEELVATAPGDLKYKIVLAVSKATLGGFQLDRIGNGHAALELFEQSLRIRREILAQTPGDEAAKQGVCNILGAIARSHLKLGNPARARVIYREESQLRDQFSPAFAANVEVRRERAGLDEKLGDVCLDLNDFEGARAAYDRSLQSRKLIADNYPDHLQAHRDVMLSVRKIATLDLFAGANEAALQGYRKVLDDCKSRLREFPGEDSVKIDLWVKQDVAIAEYMIATAYFRLKQGDAAREHFRACLDIRLSLPDDPRLKLNVLDLVIAKARCGQHEDAARTLRKFLDQPQLDARIYYFAACGFALCAGSVAELPASAENAALGREYTAAAINTLRQAWKAGWRGPGDLNNDPDLDPIRNDPGFVAFLKEFSASLAP